MKNLSCDLAIPPLGVYSRNGEKNYIHKNTLYENFHSGFMHNIQKYPSVHSRRMDKEMKYSSACQNKCTTDTCNSMEVS